jgi:general stress protein 26
MQVDKQKTAALDKVGEIVWDAKFAMLTTSDADGTLHSRPMATLHMDEDGNLWFFTSQSSHKVADMRREHHVNLNYMRTDKQDYLSVSGSAETVYDRSKMQALWTPWIEPWFPNGLDDPDLTLLRVRIDAAEYWDAPGNVFQRLYGLAKAFATGDTDALGEHEKLRPH